MKKTRKLVRRFKSAAPRLLYARSEMYGKVRNGPTVVALVRRLRNYVHDPDAPDRQPLVTKERRRPLRLPRTDNARSIDRSLCLLRRFTARIGCGANAKSKDSQDGCELAELILRSGLVLCVRCDRYESDPREVPAHCGRLDCPHTAMLVPVRM